jgi:hypothetical protein
MESPIVLNESTSIDTPGDVSIYQSVRELTLHVEPVDVENGEYFAFDAEGRLMVLETDGRTVTVRAAEPETIHRDDLVKLLRQSLISVDFPERIVNRWNLTELVKVASVTLVYG